MSLDYWFDGGVFLILSSALAEPSEAGPHPPPLPTGRNPTAGRTVGTEEMREHDLMTSTIERPERAETTGASASTLGITPVPFDSIGVEPALVEVLASQGITTAFPIQAMTVADALAGRDVCGKAKTGSGKTLAFGVPLLQRTMGNEATEPGRPRGLVLVPTRELAVQVHDVLEPLAEAIGLRLVAVYGGADIDRQVKKLRRGVDVIIATPGRLIDLGDRGELTVADIETLVLDEADRMADMGFMPQVEWVLRRLERSHQTLLFSATLDGAVDRLVSRYLTDPVMHEVASPQTTVEEMEHRFLHVHQMDRVKVAAAICRNVSKSIVFVRTKRGADRLVEQLRKEGVDAAAIHGDLRQANRERTLKDFSDGKLPALVATDVAARGLDIDAVDVVIHFDPPEDHKAYLHRSGRTARAGEAGVVVTLVQWNQVLEVERIQTRIGLKMPIVEIFSNDPRLANLAEWNPAEDAA
jgi:superfamily II DNA/RNA helicase